MAFPRSCSIQSSHQLLRHDLLTPALHLAALHLHPAHHPVSAGQYTCLTMQPLLQQQQLLISLIQHVKAPLHCCCCIFSFMLSCHCVAVSSPCYLQCHHRCPSGMADCLCMQAAGRRVAYHTFSHVLDLDVGFHLERRTGALSRILERGAAMICTLCRTCGHILQCLGLNMTY